MTEEECELIHKLRNEFYKDYGQLVAKYVKKVPAAIWPEMEEAISESSNPYSSCYQDFL